MRYPVITWTVFVCLIAGLSAALGAADKPKGLTYQQKRDVTRLAGMLKKKDATEEEKEKAFAQLLKIGGEATQKAFAVVGSELQRSSAAYQSQFNKRASVQLKTQIKEVNFDEIKAMQDKVNALRLKENLSKEEIIKVADPIMEKLFSLFLVKAESVLANDPELAQQREALIQSSDMWNRCQKAMAQEYAVANPDAPPVNLPSFEEYIQSREKLAALLAMPMSSANRSVIMKNVSISEKLSHEEASGILACNLYRNLLGLNAVAIDLKLCEAGRDHSKDMAEKSFFAHESPVKGKTRFSDRARNFGSSASSENIYMGSTKGESANLAWFHSPGHHKNMLGNHRRIGLGCHGRHWTEMFGR